MSDQLQDICMSQGLPIYRPASGDAIEVIATGDYPTASHWFRIFERPNGQVGILLDFPAYETKGIEHVDRFCELVTENFFGSCGRLYFNQAEKRFFLGGIAEKKTLASHLTSLAYGCDAAYLYANLSVVKAGGVMQPLTWLSLTLSNFVQHKICPSRTREGLHFLGALIVWL